MGCFQSTGNKQILRELERLNIVHVMVPRNMTHLQPLDLTTNGSMKKMQKQSFSRNPRRDIATIEVDLRLSTLKPVHERLKKIGVFSIRKRPGNNCCRLESIWNTRRNIGNRVFTIGPFA